MIKRVAAIVGLLLALGAAAAVAIAVWPEHTGESRTTSTSENQDASNAGRDARPSELRRKGSGPTDIGTAPVSPYARFALQRVTGPLPVRYRFKHPPLAGILFDVRTGQVLWQRNPGLEHQIASLTKMMTALMVARNDPPDRRV